MKAGFDWDLTGDPPEIPESEDLGGYARRAIEEIQREFSVTLEAINAGTLTAPQPPEHVFRFDQLSETLLQLGVFWDGQQEPPKLEDFPPENREMAAGILEEMLTKFPKTIAERQAPDYISILDSILHAEPYRDAPLEI